MIYNLNNIAMEGIDNTFKSMEDSLQNESTVKDITQDSSIIQGDTPLPETPNKESIEQMLNSFSDMLQSEMYEIASELKSAIMQSTDLNKQHASFVTHEISSKFVNVIEQQEATIQKQHQSITKFQEDLLYKIQQSLILEIIEIADNIRIILQDQENKQDYDTLLESVHKLEEWVQATLSNNSVRRFCDTEISATELNRKRQEVIDTEITYDSTKNNTYVCERPGYIWTMPYLIINSEVQLEKILEENRKPQSFAYVIRPEEVIKLKYKEKM